MVTGYGGTYRGSVINDIDPLDQHRLEVLVPEVYADAAVWAAASTTDDSGLPSVGESVWVSFEHGETDYPVWQRVESADAPGDGGGYPGKYHGRVTDNNDPVQERRLQVMVPDVDSSPAWATAGSEVEHLDVPEIDCEVWIEYENGDPAYPRWVGLI
jgi:hypothetical protein